MPPSYYVFDFTAPKINTTKDDIITILKATCKKWTFQMERGETGYEHFQGRISLKEKKSSAQAVAKHLSVTWHFSVTSKANQDNNYYVTKSETRIEGPWSDKDVETYIPRQYRNILTNLKPWQQQVIEISEQFDPRTVHCLVDERGGRGKSSIANALVCSGKALYLPPTNDSKELIQSCCNMCMDKETRDPKLIFINLPRAMDQKNVQGIYKAIEQIKDGMLYDTRYHYRQYAIDSPCVWVFCNEIPDRELLSKDRWKIWTICEDDTLYS